VVVERGGEVADTMAMVAQAVGQGQQDRYYILLLSDTHCSFSFILLIVILLNLTIVFLLRFTGFLEGQEDFRGE
jgi:hypothetical protein